MKYFISTLLLVLFTTGCSQKVAKKHLDPQYLKNHNTGANLIANNMVCYKCETGQWPKSLHEMKNSTTSCDTKYLILKNPDGSVREVPNIKIKVVEKPELYQVTLAGPEADINNLTLRDNFSFMKINKSRTQCN